MKRPTQDGICSPRRLASWLAGAFVLLAASVLVAESPREEPASETPPAPGLRAYVDPATGELTSAPSPWQVEALSKSLAQALRRSGEGLEPFALSGGGRGVHLRGRFQNALVVHLDADGGLDFLCVDDSEHAAAILELPELTPAAAPQPSSPEDQDQGAETRWVER